MLPILLFPLFLSILSLTQLVNISHMAGLNDDFSNLVLQVVNENGTTTVPYTIVGMQDGQWAMVNATLPGANGTLVASAYPDYSYNGTGAGNQTANAGSAAIGQAAYSSGYAYNETLSNASAPENGSGVPSGYENINDFMNQSNISVNQTINGSSGYVNAGPSLNTTNASVNGSGVPSGYEDIGVFMNQSNITVNQTRNISSGYIDVGAFLNATNQAGSFEAISAGTHERGSTKLIQLSYNGSQAEMSADAYDMLADNASVRLIVEGGSGFSRYGRNISTVENIPSRGLHVVTVDKRSLALLLQAGASKIYLDTPVQALLNDSIPLIRADEAAEDFNLSGQGIAVCLLDTGVDYNESQFGGQVLQGYDLLDNVSGAMDDNGHGTLMASIIHSIAPGATIVPVKVLDSTGHGYSSDIIQGIDYCRQVGQNVRIISMSFGGGNFTDYCDSDPLAMAVEDAYDAGILPVASSGNDGGAAITLPACAMNATAVASTSGSDLISSFSSMNGMVDLLAPGEGITAEGLGGPQTRSGTSISAADVSGAAALLVESNSTLEPVDITRIFRTTGIPISYEGVTYPRIDVLNAVMDNATGNPVIPPVNESNGTGVDNFSIAIWTSASFDRCMNITIINVSSSSLANFPALINVAYNTDMQSNYSDLRFYSAGCNNGGTLLPYEIENYTAANAIVWVGIPTMNAANTTISVYYKNNTAVSSGQNATGVWDANFRGVWHLNQNPAGAAPQMKDSTSNGNNGTAAGLTAANQVSGQIDGSLNFTGSSTTTVVVPNSTSTDITGNILTISAWIKPVNQTGGNSYVFQRGNNTGVEQYALVFSRTNTSSGAGSMGAVVNNTIVARSANNSITINNWAYVAFVCNGTAVTDYLNGVVVNTTNYNTTLTSVFESNISFGIKWPNSNAYLGGIDEVELSNAARSAQWINQSYQMQYNNSKWIVFGAAQTRPTTGVALNSPANGSLLNSTSVNFNWTCTGSSSLFTANLTIDGVLNVSAINSTNNTATNYSVSGLALSNHTWSITCIDPNNNSIASATWNFTLQNTCPVINASGTTTMTGNYVGAPNNASPLANFTCVKIAASNVTLNCNGFSITNNGTNGTTYGILLNGSISNVTIENCPGVSNYTYGIYVYNSNHSNIFNSTAFNNSFVGMDFNSSSNDTITNSTGSATSGFGLYLNATTNSQFVNVTGSAISGYGIYIQSSANFTITNSTGSSSSQAGIVLANSSNETITNCIGTSNSSYGIYLTINSNGTITNSSGNSNTSYGFFLNQSNSNNLTGDNASGSFFGFYLVNSSSNQFTNSFAYNDTNGFVINSSSNSNNFTNNSAYGNSNIGLLIYDSNLTTVQGMHFYNNSPDLEVQDDFGSQIVLNLTSMVFDNRLGNYQNYTNLSINDTVNNSETYSIKWTTNSSALPSGYSSFAQEFVNISVISGAPSISSVTWSWLASQLSGYNQSWFGLFDYNGTWQLLNNSPNTTTQTLSITNLTASGIYGILELNSTPNVTLKAPGNNSILNISSANFNFTAVDSFSSAMNCSLYVDGTLKGTNTSVSNNTATNITVGSIADGKHTWYVQCENAVNNTGTSATWNFTVQNNCPVINASGTETMVTNFVGAPNNASPLTNFTCVKIAASNVTLNCNGFSITNNGTNGTTYGILLNGSISNVTIENCPGVSNYTYGIYVYNSNHSNIFNSTAFNNSFVGMDFNSSSNDTITNSTGSATSGFGLYLNATTNSQFVNVTGSAISGYGIYIQSSANFTITNSTGSSSSQAGIVLANSSNETITNCIGTSNSSYGIYLTINSNGTITNSSGNSNTSYGFFLNQSNSNNLTGDNASGSFFGFYLVNSSSNQFTNSFAYNDTNGFVINSSSNSNNFTNNSAYGNSNIGLLIYDSNLTTVQGMHFYNNSPDLEAQDDQGSSFILNLSSMIFDSPLDNYQNYTNLSINDTVNSGETYSIKWTTTQTAPPYTSFAQTYVNISTIAGAVSINSIVWSWISGQLTGYNSSLFQLWNYNATGWTMLNSTPNTVGNTLGLFNLAPQNIYAILQVAKCPIINSSGVYKQGGNYIGAPNNASPLTNFTCVEIAASNVTFDCNGFTITNNATAGTTYGILVNGSLKNVTVQNCPGISNYTYGIYVYQSNNSIITNSTAYNNTNCGLSIYSGSNNSITNSIAYNNAQYGFCLITSSGNNITNSTAYNNTNYGFDVSSSSNDTIANSIAYNNPSSGFSIYSGSNNSITNNSVYNNAYGFLLSSTSNDTFTNNTAYSNPTGFYIYSSSNNTFTNNSAYSSTYGFFLSTSSNNNILTNNSAYSSTYGFFLSNSSNSTITNSIAYNNTQYGFDVYSSSNNNTLINNSAYNNPSIGLMVYDSNLTAVRGMHFYNNSPDLEVQDDQGSSFILNLSSIVFDNPLGNYQNYTNLSINDTVNNSETYSINWTTNQTAPPYTSFAQTYVNISTIAGAVSIDSIVWSWTSGQLTGYNSSLFELWGYNSSGWTMLNSTPNTAANILGMTNFNPGAIYGILQYDGNCPLINKSQVYTENTSYTGAPNVVSQLGGTACVEITASNVTFNCNGYNITNKGVGGTTYGIVLNGSLTNVTVENCPGVSNYSYGIYVYKSNNSVIINSTAYNNTQSGFDISSSSNNNTITNSSAYNNTYYGFYLESSFNNTITNSTAHNNPSSGFAMYSGSNNTLTNDSAYNNAYGFLLAYTSNNTIANSSTYNNTNYGFYLGFSSNNTIANSTAHNNPSSFTIISSSNNILTSNTAYNNSLYGFDIYSSSNNTIANSTAYSNSYYGFYLESGSNNNTITNSTAYNDTFSGFYLGSSSNNSILINNTAYSNPSTGLMVYDSNQTTVRGMHFYNNSPDLEVQDDFGSQIVLNLTSMVFDNRLGNYQNYTNLSINDTVNNSETYSIKWTTNSSALPSGYSSFAQEFVNISVISGAPVIDYTAWSWLASQLGGYNQSWFGLFDYNGTWQLLNNSPNTAAQTLSITNLTSSAIYGILELNSTPKVTLNAPGNNSTLNSSSVTFNFTAVDNISTTMNCSIYLDGVFNQTNTSTSNNTATTFMINNVTDGNHTWYVACENGANNTGTSATWNFTMHNNCPVVSASGTYTQNSNYVGAPNTVGGGTACVEITASNVVFNCNGYNITNNGTGGTTYGVIVSTGGSLTNVTVKNCPSISSYSHGVYLSADNSSTISNVTAHNNSQDDFALPSSTLVTFVFDTSYGSPYGFHLITSTNNNFTDNTAHDASTAAFFLDGDGSNYNNFTSNSVYNSADGFYLLGGYAGSSDNNFINDSAYNNSRAGFDFYTAAFNNLTGNNASGNAYGFRLAYSPGNQLANNTASYDAYGFVINTSSEENILTNDSAYGNSIAGLLVNNSGPTLTAVGMHFFNNSLDLMAQAASVLNFTGIVFDNPLGNYQNYTNLSINDSVDSGEAYSINWSMNTSTLPTGYISFAQEFVNITMTSGSPSIDSVTWSWIASQLSGYNQSWFGLFDYNGTWQLLNNSPNTTTQTLSITNLTASGIYGILELNSTPNVTLNAPGNNSISSTSSVTFNFTAVDNISTTMNCSIYLDGVFNQTNTSTGNNTATTFTINGISDGKHTWYVQCENAANNTGTSAIWNFTVQSNCPVVTTSGTYTQSTNYIGAPNNATPLNNFTCVKIAASNVIFNCNRFNITNNGTNGTTYGMLVNGSLKNVTIVNCPGVSGYTTGIYVYQSNSTNITNDGAYNNTYGIQLTGSSGVNISLSNFTNNSNTGLAIDSLSGSNTFASDRFCFNNVSDINNSGSSNSGSLDACGYWSNWNENSHAGCAYSCSLVWQEFFGNITGKQFLAPNHSQIFYSWIWNGTSGMIFAFNSGVSINWANITALGKNTTGGSSTTDFTTLDTLLSMNGSPDNITGLYSNGSAPKATANMTIYGRPVTYVPLANSSSASSNSSSTTGILWDDSTNTGGHFASGSNVVFVTQVNQTSSSQYDIRVPSGLSTYGSGSGTVQFWVEMD